MTRIFLSILLASTIQGFCLQAAYALTQDYTTFSIRVPDEWTLVEQQEADGITLYMSAQDGFTSKIVTSGLMSGRSAMDIAEIFAARFDHTDILPEEDTLYFTFNSEAGKGICLIYTPEPHYIVECMAGDNKEYTRVGVNPKY